MFKFFVIKTCSDIDLAPIIELRYGLGIFSRCIAEFDGYAKAAAVANRLNKDT